MPDNLEQDSDGDGLPDHLDDDDDDDGIPDRLEADTDGDGACDQYYFICVTNYYILSTSPD